MERYLHYFETVSEFEAEYSGNYKSPWVSYTEEDDSVAYNKEDFSTKPLTYYFSGLGENPQPFSVNKGARDIYYSINDGEWSNSYTNGSYIILSDGDVVKFKGTTTSFSGQTNTYPFIFPVNAINGIEIEVEGNIMSVIDGDNFTSLNGSTLTRGAFAGFFRSTSGLIDASRLVLPATVIPNECYYNLFYYCMDLEKAPSILPALSVPGGGYSYMFDNCKKLKQAPRMLATEVSTSGCTGMFRNCGTLTTAPEILAETISGYCFQYMFQNCSGITTGPSILPAMTLSPMCYMEMFSNCTSLTRAPILPAVEISPSSAYSCYNGMFKDCSSLNYIKCMSISDITQGLSPQWVVGVSQTGTFVKNANATWDSGSYGIGQGGIPSGWTIETAVA